MAVPKDPLWELEKHTKAKHEILCRYLGAWFAILGSKFPGINYIDGFAGPGKYKGGEEGSPILALKIAASHRVVSKFKEVSFTFVEKDKDRVDYLQKEVDNISIPIPANFQIDIRDDEFESVLCEILDDLDKQEMVLAPTFAFIDPFGFSGLSYSLIERILANPRSEVFINFMADAVNRWVTDDGNKAQKRIIELFGTEEVVEIIKTSRNRIQSLKALYQSQLKKIAKFVRYFKMYNSKNRIIYVLFFAGNNRLGHIKMKKAFWKVDPSSGVKFSDATNPDQPTLFDLNEDHSVELADVITNQFAGQTIACEDIRLFVEDETIYIKTHMDSALGYLEQESQISVEEFKRDGSKRRKNNFHDDVIVKFNK